MLNLDDLTFKIRLDDSGVERTATNVSGQMQRLAAAGNQSQRSFGMLARGTQQLGQSFQGLNFFVAGLAGSLAALFSVAGISNFLRSTANAVDALNDAADATGVTVEMLSALELVAKRNGATLDTVASILVKFNGALKDADGTDNVSRTLRAIGLDAAELRRLDPAEALRLTAVALAGFADDGDKARVVQELFGKSVREAAPFLKDLAEAGELNATTTREQGAQAEQFNKHLSALSASASLLGRTLVVELLPPMNDYLEKLQRAVSSGGSIFGAEVVSELQSLRLSMVVSQIEAMTEAANKFPANRAYTERLAELRREYDELAKSAGRANEKLKGLVGTSPARDAGGGRGFVNPDAVRPSIGDVPGKPKPRGTAKEVREFFNQAQDQLEERLRQGLDRYVDSQYDALARTYQQGQDFGRQLIEQTEMVNAMLIEDDEARARAMMAIEQAQIDARISALQLSAEQEAEIRDRAADYYLARERQLTLDLRSEYEKRLADNQDLEKLFKRTGTEFREGFNEEGKRAFREWVATGKASTEGLTNFIRNKFADMAYDKFISKMFDELAKGLFKSLTGSGSGGGGFLDGLLKAVGVRASGGDVQRGGLYQVNEFGPELVTVKGRDYLMMGSDFGKVTPTGGASSSTAGGRQQMIDASLSIGSVGAGTSRAEVQAIVRNALAQQELRLRRLWQQGNF